MKRFISTGFMAIYWVALPLSALLMVGLGWMMLAADAVRTSEGSMPLWLSFLLSIVLTLLIAWRLWTHERARRLASGRSSPAEVSGNKDD